MAVQMRNRYTMVRLALILVVIGTLLDETSAQFGARLLLVQATVQADASDIGSLRGQSGVEAALHYWWRLPEHRLEFFPEVSYALVSVESSSPLSEVQRYGLSIPVRAYVLDFVSDCDCPTFSKQNDLFKDGFFLQLSGGYFFSRANDTTTGDGTTDWSGTLGGSLGMGLDIGLSDLVTLTPMVNYSLYGDPSGDQGQPHIDKEWRIGLSATFRPDYKKF